MDPKHKLLMYRGPRLFVESELSLGQVINLHRDQSRYLLNVMRRGNGDQIRIFNGSDGEWLASLIQTGRDKAALKLDLRVRIQKQTNGPWLAFSMIKRGPTELIVEKATELGVSKLLPVRTSRSNSDRINIERLVRIAVEASEQSERLDVPKIKEPVSLPDLISNWPNERILIVGDETGCSPPILESLNSYSSNSYGLLIGPEGGFTSDELDGFSHIPFVRKISLGPRILRAETAAIAGLVLAQAKIGDFSAAAGSED